jgi:hypothetical protein
MFLCAFCVAKLHFIFKINEGFGIYFIGNNEKGRRNTANPVLVRFDKATAKRRFCLHREFRMGSENRAKQANPRRG